MLPLILAAVAGGLMVNSMTGYPAEIRNLRKQMPKEDRDDFIRDYKKLPNETKTQFKKFLKEANMAEAGKLIGKDLSGYTMKAKVKAETAVLPTEPQMAAPVDNGFNERIKNILAEHQLESDPQLLADAAKQYESIDGFNQMNIVDKTRKLLDVSQ